MTDHRRATWLAATRLVPLPAIGAVTAIGSVGVALVAGTPDRLRAWIVLTGVVLAAVATGAVDDPTESLAASTPVARRQRWTMRVTNVAVVTAAAIAVVAGTGAWTVSDHAESTLDVLHDVNADTVAFQVAAYAMVGWAVAAAAARTWGARVRCPVRRPGRLGVPSGGRGNRRLVAALAPRYRRGHHRMVAQRARTRHGRLPRSRHRPGPTSALAAPMSQTPLSERPDAELLDLIATESSRDAMQELYDRHVSWLSARLKNRCADDGVVHDALQDTFVAVWRNAGGYNGTGEVPAWLWGIAIRRLIGQLRRQPRVLDLRHEPERNGQDPHDASPPRTASRTGMSSPRRTPGGRP